MYVYKFKITLSVKYQQLILKNFQIFLPDSLNLFMKLFQLSFYRLFVYFYSCINNNPFTFGFGVPV